MRSQAFIPDDRSLAVESVSFEETAGKVVVVVRSTCDDAKCPKCEKRSDRVHSFYSRRLSDLPWQGLNVVLTWRSRKFFCRQPSCSQRIFTERLPQVAKPHAQRTERLNVAARCIGIACGGESGARLAKRLGIKLSPDSLLREIRCTSIPTKLTPRVLGVDDWAFRKGQRYGTVLVDLEKNCPVDLLPDRDPASLVSWLNKNPGVKFISRDRGDCYIKGATEGAPQATQIADRFHLMQNLREALGRLITRHSKKIRDIAKVLADRRIESKCSVGQTVQTSSSETANEPSIASQRRRERYCEVMDLFRKGVAQREISRRLGLARSTVRRFVQADAYPERAPRQTFSHADRCVDYLWKRWQEGCHNVRQLTDEIHERGFKASYYSVRRRVAPWRNAAGAMPKRPPAKESSQSPAQLSWTIFRDDASLPHDQVEFKDLVLEQCSEIAVGWRVAKHFIKLFKEKLGDELQNWIKEATRDEAPRELRSFAKGVFRDSSAIAAAITLPWSNGQTEGQVNRLKTLKRQMYGRGSFELLRLRFLAVA